MNIKTTLFAAAYFSIFQAPAAEDAFAGASWIGESGASETEWRRDQALVNRGIEGKEGRAWRKLASPLPKRCPRFRKTFALGPGPISRAEVRVSGMGFYELWVNGRKADPLRVLAPGVTGGGRVLADCYDVASLLEPGADNTLGLWLAPGYSDDFSCFCEWTWLAPVRAILSLEVETEGGAKTRVLTDGSWETTCESPILSASIYHGETYDAALEDREWATPRGARKGWSPATAFPDGPQTLLIDAPPVRMSDPRHPVSLVETSPGVFTADFGQNRAGFVAVRAKGPRGTRIRIRTSELAGAGGKIDPWTNYNARSTDEFILAGTGGVEEYVPRFTYHGFRYAEITGWPGRPSVEDITGWAVHADVKPAGSFRCSDETLMRLDNAAKWSMLSNFMSYPTDCCMRDERTPCLMDSMAYEDAACAFFDMRGYYARWFEAIRGTRGGNPDWTGDVAMLPLRLWRQYGDAHALARNIGDVLGYVDSVAEEHPDFIFTEGFGDWCAPNEGTWKSYFREPGFVNSAIFCSILRETADALEESGRRVEESAARRRFAAARAAFNEKFYDCAAHRYGGGTQTEMVLPLAFGLVPEADRAAVAAGLVRRIRTDDGGRIDTGIFGTRYIGEVLCDVGECDLLLDMYTSREYPGFGHLFANGATTLWEQWRSAGEMNSHNHAMFAGGATWLYTRLAGIRPAAAGYSRVLVKPCYPRTISFVEASRTTPAGEIKVRWSRAGGAIEVEVDIPGGASEAVFDFPDGTRRLLSKGLNKIRIALD